MGRAVSTYISGEAPLPAKVPGAPVAESWSSRRFLEPRLFGLFSTGERCHSPLQLGRPIGKLTVLDAWMRPTSESKGNTQLSAPTPHPRKNDVTYRTPTGLACKTRVPTTSDEHHPVRRSMTSRSVHLPIPANLGVLGSDIAVHHYPVSRKLSFSGG